MSEENKTQPENELTEELTEDELDQVAGGLLPAVQVSAGDVNNDAITDGTSNTILNAVQKVRKP